MRIKIVQFPISLLVIVLGLALITSLLTLFTIGVMVGLIVEMFKLHSRASARELAEYKISRPVEKSSPNRKSKKIIKLPVSDKVVSKRMVYLHDQYEKELSKFR